MSEEKKIILNMIEKGTVNAQEGLKLLDQIDSKSATTSLNDKLLKVYVSEGDEVKADVNIPLALAEVSLKLIPKDKLKIEGVNIDFDQVIALIKTGIEGKLIDINTSSKGKKVIVKVSIESKLANAAN